jgi:hypothetical protein
LASDWLRVGTAIAVVAVGCATSPSASFFVSNLDAGNQGGGGGIGDASLDATSCHPGDVQTFSASYHPAVKPQSVCRADVVQPNAIVAADPIALFYDACFGPHRSSFSCASFASASPAYAACAKCIETPATAAQYGPLIVDAVSGFAHPNVGGCIEITDPLALSCAKAAQAQEACEVTACAANCPMTDDVAAYDVSLAAFDACTAQAAAGGCKAFATAAATCVDAQASSAVGPCLTMTFRDFYDAVVPLFCAASPLDAAAPPPDVADTGPVTDDAARAVDASLDAASDAESSDATRD